MRFEEWRETTIGSEITLQRGFDITRNQQREGKIPVISSSGINSYHDTALVKAPGIVIGRKGSLGTVFYIERDYWPHDTTLWVKDFHGNYPKFVYYFFKTLKLQEFNVGTASPTLNRNHVHPIKTLWPPLPEQKEIAHILGTLDDKIELNHQMNQTLEAMAKAIFKSWFVDFDPVRSKMEGRQPEGMDVATAELFPDSFEDSALDLIPKGWRVGTVLEVCKSIYSGGTPSTKNLEYWNGNISWLSSGETRNQFIDITEKTITSLGVANSSTRLAKAGTIVIASAGQGNTRGQTSLLMIDSYINQSVVALQANLDIISELYLFLDLSRRYQEFRQISDSHSSRGSLTTKLLAQVKIVIPSKREMIAFDKIIRPLVNQIVGHLQQSRTLANLRDSLLPKLMSGEIRVKEAERAINDVL